MLLRQSASVHALSLSAPVVSNVCAMTAEPPVLAGRQLDRSTNLSHYVSKLASQLTEHEALILGVSGGSDSMALLHLAANAFPGRIIAATVDHRLREASAEEASRVRGWCSELGVPHHILVWREAKAGAGLQARARDARYALLGQLAREMGTPERALPLVLAHTKDDVSETFLMRLFHRSGPDGLSGLSERSIMPGSPPLVLLRPLLSASRQELQSYLIEAGQGWIEDSSNKDERFERVRWRKRLAALAEQGVDMQVLTRASSAFGDLRSLVDREAHALLSGPLVVSEGLDWLSLSLNLLRSIPAPLRAHLLKRLILAHGGGGFPPSPDALHWLSDQVVSEAFAGQTLGGCRIAPRGETEVLVGREVRPGRLLTQPVEAGKVYFWDNRWVVSVPNEFLGSAVLGPLGPTKIAVTAPIPRAWLRHGLPVLRTHEGDVIATPEWVSLELSDLQMPRFEFLGRERILGDMSQAYAQFVAECGDRLAKD